MLTIHSFLQRVFHFVKNLTVKISKKMYRNAVVLTAGFAIITVVAFTSTGFGGGGRNALIAFAETKSELAEEPEELSEEAELITEAKIQVDLTDSRRKGQLVVGELLAQNIQKQEENQLTAKAELEKVKREIQLEEEAKAKARAEEEARQRAEEARQKEEEARKAAAVVSYTDKDYQVLLKIVQAEAGICDTKGRVLVANVILNRVKSEEFPNNITDVVYQKSQFSPVSNGSINTVEITQKTKESVDRALAGEDYSKGALYFMYRGGSQSQAIRWFDKRLTFLFQHERHEFFK